MDDVMTDALELPAPLVPAEIDLRNYRFMSLDVVRLRDSRVGLMEDAEAFRAAVFSWCAAWHQLPAASLPDDDVELCRLLGYGRELKRWCRLRANGALHGWVKCSDGRLYHPVVAEKAVEAWDNKVAQINRTRKATKALAERREHRGEQRDDQRREHRDDSHDEHRDDQRNDEDTAIVTMSIGTKREERNKKEQEEQEEKKERKQDAAFAAVPEVEKSGAGNGIHPPTAPPPTDRKATFYRRFSEVWGGKNSGGMATKLLAAKGSVGKAMAAVEMASEAGNAKEYLAACINGAEKKERDGGEWGVDRW